MGVFDTIKEINGQIQEDKWIAWIHEGYKIYNLDYRSLQAYSPTNLVKFWVMWR